MTLTVLQLSLQFGIFLITWLKDACQYILFFYNMKSHPSFCNQINSSYQLWFNSLIIPIDVPEQFKSYQLFVTRRGETKEFFTGTRLKMWMMTPQKKDFEETCNYSDCSATIKGGIRMRERRGDCSWLSWRLLKCFYYYLAFLTSRLAKYQKMYLSVIKQ